MQQTVLIQEKLAMFICILGDFSPRVAVDLQAGALLREDIGFNWPDLRKLGKWIRHYWTITIPPDDWADIDTFGDLTAYLAENGA